MTRPLVRRARPDELPACHAVRHAVFVVGQGVPVELEVDGRDHACLHVIAWLDDRPVGAARLRPCGEHVKVERVAVLEAYRGRGVGLALMVALEGEARDQGYPHVHLHAQTPVLGFYERQGYVPAGPTFHEAGIPHRAMRKVLSRG